MYKEFYNQSESEMQKSIDHLTREYNSLRTSRANVALLDNIKVNYYGNLMPVNQVATISIPEPRCIMLKPWDKNAFQPIEKAILESPLGINPVNDGNVIRLNIPALTEEKRKHLVKIAGKYAEEAKIGIRNTRRDINDRIKQKEKEDKISEDLTKKALEQVQKITDKYIKKVDEILAKKTDEIMEI